ncbi:protocadherin fat 4 [Plakobranchus ocellatus]|uniref:Protocadherin fat 4 n=1 Tax=Plakobranchus ocellatus TaxID=259542 RepID=A0AAV3XWZ1_9GAST|nr:protocadherin fat 4 [Plakobranchus ocellatus]
MWRYLTMIVLCPQVAIVGAQFNNPPSIPVNYRRFFQASEGDPVGKVVFTLKANDQDPNDVLEFTSLTDETKALVSLGTPVKGNDQTWSCDLSLNQRLDRDQSPETRTLFFGISDRNAQVQLTIIMIIEDVNDNPPTFLGLPYKTSIPEDFQTGVNFFSVSAIDPDLNSGGTVVYTIATDNIEYQQTFEIQEYVGDIQLKKQLDYEDRSFYHLKVSATDQGQPPCPGLACLCNASEAVCEGEPVDLFITVEDVQDTPPVFERLFNMYSVPEDSTLPPCPGLACLCNASEAVCEGEPVDLFITVEDVQDTPPVFERLFNMYSVPEDSPLGFSILQVQATDGDRGVAVPNQATEVPSSGSTSPASLDPKIYSTLTNVSIIVTDVDDHAPTFNEDTYTASVLENTPSGAPLTVSPSIIVSDLDQGENSRFRVSVQKDGAPYNGFATLPGAGQIIQGSSSVTITVGDSSLLDYENTHSITFQLVLIEEHPSGNAPVPSRPTSTATVVLDLQDANDNSPVFPSNQTRSFFISEDADLGFVVGAVTAVDADSENFGKVVFSLETDGHNEEFNISLEGVISLAKQLDRETRSSYSLVVMATDSPDSPLSQQRSSRFPITVYVEDVNDVDPQWTQVIPLVSVQESADIGTKITDLIAIDGDQGVNGQIGYSIAPGTNGSSLFSVQEIDGRAELRVGSSLIGHSGLLLVKVIATDKGAEPRSSEAGVTVLVIDENQFDPVFTNPDEDQLNVSAGELPEITVDEEQAINTILMQLQATDRDQGLNGEINFFLVPSLNKDFEFFTVDRETGYLRAARRLDRETKEAYEVDNRLK